eukprot:11505309-Alexandrium_andersonii.AAC.1
MDANCPHLATLRKAPPATQHGDAIARLAWLGERAVALPAVKEEDLFQELGGQPEASVATTDGRD